VGAPSVKIHKIHTEAAYWPNGNYGNERTLKRYAGYPMHEPVWAVIPHGVFYEDDYVFEGEAKAPVPCVLNYPKHRDEVWSRYKEVVPAAAPFLYALATYPHATERKGTIVMPQHSTTLLDMEFDWHTFADSLQDLPRPITTLLYYNDVQQGVDKYFYGRASTLKTCGHVQDQRYLEKLVGYLTGAEWVVSNDVGSYTYYATAAGAKFRLLGDSPKFYLNEQGKANGFQDIFFGSEDRHPEEKARIAEVDALFRDHDYDEPITADQRDASDYYLRRSCLKSPEGLLADLDYCKSRHRP
jgi:hypothetical protein